MRVYRGFVGLAGLVAAALLLAGAAAAGEKKNPAATPSPRMGKGAASRTPAG